jgi:hypothetical protein
MAIIMLRIGFMSICELDGFFQIYEKIGLLKKTNYFILEGTKISSPTKNKATQN